MLFADSDSKGEYLQYGSDDRPSNARASTGTSLLRNTPISRSRHFEIENEAPGGKKPGSIAFNHRSSGHIVVFQAVHPINEKSVIKSCHFIAF